MLGDANLKPSISTIPTYIPVINSLRGLASLMVCIVHIGCMPHGLLDRNGLLYPILGQGYLGVMIFFVITGVVIPIALINGNYTYSLWGKFMLKRITRIEPPYIASLILFIIFILVKVQYKHSYNLLTPKIILLHIGYLIPFVKNAGWINPVFWTLAIEFQFYILISLVIPLFISARLPIRILSYLLMFGLALYFPNIKLAPSWLPVFTMGIIYASWRYKKAGVIEFWIILTISAVISLYSHQWAQTITGLFTLLIIHFFSQYKNTVGNFLGNISYSLYLVHLTFPIAIVNKLSEHVNNFYLKLLVIVIGILISIAFAYVFYLLVEKPSKKLSATIRFGYRPISPKTDTQ